MRIFGHIDCNSFFASCEKVFHPEWRDRPVVVLSNNDGCIVARSPEAKALGIPMGIPLFKIKNQINHGGVIVCSGNFSLYGNMSQRVMQTLEQWCPDIEIYSIDEAFLDLTGYFLPILNHLSRRGEKIPDGLQTPFFTEVPTELDQAVVRLAREIVSTVEKWTGIPVSFGLGPTKTLAKVANRIAKKLPDHCAIILSGAERERQLRSVELGDVWGVGRHLLPRLERLGLRSAWDLARVDPIYMRNNFSVIQEKLVRELCGESCLDLETEVPNRQNIQYSRSFGTAIYSLDELEKAVSTFAAQGAVKLRRQGSVASAIHVRLYTNPHHQEQPQYYPGISAGFPVPTASSPEIIALALRMTRKIFKEGFAYKKASVQLLDLRREEQAAAQQTLFPLDTEKSDEQRLREKKLMKTVDSINQIFGKGALFFGSEGTNQEWTPASNYRSPCFTTRWEDLPRVVDIEEHFPCGNPGDNNKQE